MLSQAADFSSSSDFSSESDTSSSESEIETDTSDLSTYIFSIFQIILGNYMFTIF